MEGEIEPWTPQLLRVAPPLVEGNWEWLDRYVVALAEWGARLQGKGYLLQEPEDSHPLAWYLIVAPETGAEVDSMVLKNLWQQTEKHLGRFPGRARDIQGRHYLHFQDYLRWQGRKAKGGLQSGLRRGLVLASWNRWVNDSETNGTASLEGVKVSRLSSFLEGYRYHLCRDPEEVAEERRRRESLLEELRGWKPGSRRDDRYRRRISDWKKMAESFLSEVYSLRQATEAICQRYFDSHPQVPFPTAAAEFARLIKCLEEMVEGYNEDFTSESGGQHYGSSPEGLELVKPPNYLDATALEERVVPAARQQTVFLLDMARAEALDAMGENEKALELIDKYV